MEAPSQILPGPPRLIDDNYLELVEVIGTGAYGSVWRAVDHRFADKPWRAVKALRRYGLDERQRTFQRREIALHGLSSNHSSIITLQRTVEEDDYTYLVMDYGEEGDMFAMICDRQRYLADDELIRSVFLQILEGIAHIHSYGIAHRDIKPENIVCSNDGHRVRICDFGLATSESHSSEFGCGSTFYIAPECIGEASPGRKSYPTKPGDIWSLGVILVNLVCGRNPWRIASRSDESFSAFCKDPAFLRRILPLSTECLSILQGIFCIDPARRVDLHTLRKQIRRIKTFSMSESELRAVHAASARSLATRAAHARKVSKAIAVEHESQDILIEEDEEDYEEEEEGEEEQMECRQGISRQATSGWMSEDEDHSMPFDLDVDPEDMPNLLPDRGSPSRPTCQSRSSSGSSGSLPPTPFHFHPVNVPTYIDTIDCSADISNIRGPCNPPSDVLGASCQGSYFPPTRYAHEPIR